MKHRHLALLVFIFGGLIPTLVYIHLTGTANWSQIPAILASLSVYVLFALASMSWLIRKALGSYDYRAKKLYKHVDSQLVQILETSSEINDECTRDLVDSMCRNVVLFLEKVAEKTPNSRLKAATSVQMHLETAIRDLLPQYLEMQSKPYMYSQTDGLLRGFVVAIDHFTENLRGSYEDLEKGDLMRFEVALRMFDPKESAILF